MGTKTTAQVTIEGKDTNCLLDTGLQVTTVPQSFYEQHLSDLTIHPLDDLLDVEGANGQFVPYIGYIELSVTFLKDFVGTDIEVNTSALVVPHLRSTVHEQVLIGTNTLDTLYTNLQDYPNCSTFQPLPYSYRVVLKILHMHQKSSTSSNLGCAKMVGKTPEVVPAGQSVILEGMVNISNAHSKKYVIIEQLSASSLPSGLLVSASLVSLPKKQPCHLPVVIKNETVIPCYSIHDDSGKHQCCCAGDKQRANCKGTNPNDMKRESPQPAKLSFDFGDSPLPPEWKDRITTMLNSMPAIFSHHDRDFGHTDKVKHRIRLSDETPLKYRLHPIHPHDVDAVRKHLQELLDSGVIRESESPFASPIMSLERWFCSSLHSFQKAEFADNQGRLCSPKTRRGILCSC